MSVLKIRDEYGQFQDVPAIKGKDALINGKTAIQIDAGENITIDDLKKYIKSLNDKKLGEKSVARNISCIKSFYKFLVIFP